MAMMAWNPSLSVNIRQFDDQHMKLVDMINELYDAMKAGNGREALSRILKGLIIYTTTHFTEEEQLMASHSYPDMLEHKAKHEDLVKQVLDLQNTFKSGHAILTLDMIMFLKDWLVQHIQGDDRKYGVYLNSRGVH
ncbi:MAG: bacteriohemerythrin [Desulfuromonadales bacterium]